MNIYKIAIVFPKLDTQFFINILQSAIQVSEKYKNVHLIVQTPEKNSNAIERQIQIIEDLIDQKIDVFCLIPADSRSLIPTVKKINKSNIPIIIVDNPLDKNLSKLEDIKINTYIGSDDYLGGKIAANYFSKKFKKGNVFILEGSFGTDAAIDRKKGFIENINKEFKIIDSVSAYWDKENAYFILKKILTENKNKIDYIFACNDEMALGAVKACEELSKKIKIVGFDGVEDALNAIINDKMIATVSQFTEKIGENMFLRAIDILEGKTIPENIFTELKIIEKKDLI